MPELPDVENFRRYLDSTALHEPVARVHVSDQRALADDLTPQALGRRLKDRRLEQTRRHGKHLLVRLDGDGGWLTLHFGMTGRLKYFHDPAQDPEHDRVRIEFRNGYRLAYDSQRLIGSVGWTPDADAFVREKGLGPDALDPGLDLEAFCGLLADRGGQIKSALMDQGLIAGIGNVYADEILYQAGLDPRTRVQALDDAQLERLHAALREVLETAVERGAGSEELLDRLPDDYLLPHLAEDETCPRCGGPIEDIKVSGRRGWWCPRCQSDNGGD